MVSLLGSGSLQPESAAAGAGLVLLLVRARARARVLACAPSEHNHRIGQQSALRLALLHSLFSFRGFALSRPRGARKAQISCRPEPSREGRVSAHARTGRRQRQEATAARSWSRTNRIECVCAKVCLFFCLLSIHPSFCFALRASREIQNGTSSNSDGGRRFDYHSNKTHSELTGFAANSQLVCPPAIGFCRQRRRSSGQLANRLAQTNRISARQTNCSSERPRFEFKFQFHD